MENWYTYSHDTKYPVCSRRQRISRSPILGRENFWRVSVFRQPLLENHNVAKDKLTHKAPHT